VIRQWGDRNVATASQVGGDSANLIDIQQDGFDNTAATSQRMSGYSAGATILQTGQENGAVIDQNGTFGASLTALIEQTGAGNQASITQFAFGGDIEGTIIQHGDNNAASLNQSVDFGEVATHTINQIGSGNTIHIVQGP
jgi:hypothetical protein